jgi:hypothetical protein
VGAAGGGDAREKFGDGVVDVLPKTLSKWLTIEVTAASGPSGWVYVILVRDDRRFRLMEAIISTGLFRILLQRCLQLVRFAFFISFCKS